MCLVTNEQVVMSTHRLQWADVLAPVAAAVVAVTVAAAAAAAAAAGLWHLVKERQLVLVAPSAASFPPKAAGRHP